MEARVMRLVVAESDSDSERPEARAALTRKRPRPTRSLRGDSQT